ncbi:probable low affinity copper uptake protein 2 [Dendronephthya gigantea]|uniref:probable low affinity copper uptake protein 2 n=1 Tax=Dendronephthya gigantea TaxID=151771 RepID=UPI00106D0B5E|nr:probable low affinity copper uptake protein 2 [Dendronephthya gigantea]
MQHHFYFSSHVLLLFKEWQIDNSGILFAACVGVFVFTFLYGIASFYQGRFVNSQGKRSSVIQNNQSRDGQRYGTFSRDCVAEVPSSEEPEVTLRMRMGVALTARYILSSLSFPLLLAANYFIMLAVMTYNAWLLIAVCLASGLTYFMLYPNQDIPVCAPQNDGTLTPLMSSDESLTVKQHN